MQLLYDLNLPLKGVVDLAWDSWNLRLAIGIGANVFFANIRPFYKACFYGGYVYLYVYTKSNDLTHLAFWDQEKVYDATLKCEAHLSANVSESLTR